MLLPRQPLQLLGVLVVSWICLVSVQAGFTSRSWQANDGLPDNSVVGITQAPDGFLWVATQGGLARFDGFTFREYPVASCLGMPSSRLESLLLDRRGRLWLARSGGALVCIDFNGTKLFTSKDGLPNLQAMVMVEDGDGALWIAYGGGRLMRFHDGIAQSFTEQDGLPPGAGCRIASDKVGQLWFAKGGQVGVFRQGRFKTMLTLPGNVMRIASARDTGLWICADHTLYKFTEGNEPVRLGELPLTVAEAKPSDLYEDTTGAVWIGTEQAGLFRHAGGAFQKVETSHHEIWPLAGDREGNIWVGTRGGGLNRVQASVVDLQAVGSAFAADGVQSLCRGPEESLWAVTRSGELARKDGKGWRAMTPADGWPGNLAKCVAVERDGTIWVGTREQLVIAWRPGESTNLVRRIAVGGRLVRSMLVTPQDEVWVGTERPGTLQRVLRDGKLENYPLPSETGPVCAMTLDEAGNFWAGTLDGQLLRVSDGKLFDETARTLAVPQPILSLATTADGSLWIGYGGRGLGRLKNGKFSRFGVEEGLLENYISQIVPDGKGQIWLAGNRGIFRVREADLTDAVPGQSAMVFAVAAGTDVATTGVQASRGYSPGGQMSADGKILIPKANGLAVIDAQKLAARYRREPAVLDRVVVDNRIVAANDPGNPLSVAMVLGGRATAATNAVLKLSSRHQQVRFEYTSPNFSDPENVHFRYQLAGLDGHWQEAGTRRVAYYSKLSPGRYTFSVTARDAAGNWPEAQGVLSIEVTPALWETWWFTALAVVFALAFVAHLVRIIEKRRGRRRLEQERREHELERERARIARDIHDDLGANLTEISLLSAIAQGEGATLQEMREDVQQIGAKARALTVSLSEIVWAVNPRNDSFDSFVTYACNYAQDFLSRAKIRCRIDLPPQLPATAITSEWRHNVFLVMKEALNNVVKYAQATEVCLSFGLTENALRLVIKDNGRGVPIALAEEGAKTSEGRGHGLGNMRDRVEQLGGEFHMASKSGNGTWVELIVPFTGLAPG